MRLSRKAVQVNDQKRYLISRGKSVVWVLVDHILILFTDSKLCKHVLFQLLPSVSPSVGWWIKLFLMIWFSESFLFDNIANLLYYIGKAIEWKNIPLQNKRFIWSLFRILRGKGSCFVYATHGIKEFEIKIKEEEEEKREFGKNVVRSVGVSPYNWCILV